MNQITIIGRQADGGILCFINDVEMIVPDIMENRHRYVIWDEWEMGPPSPGTGERERVNTLPTYAPSTPSAANVDRERDRRIDAGFLFEGVHYQSRPEDRENIAGAKAAATDAITLFGAEAGNFGWQRLLDPNAPPEFRWIAADNSTHPMDAQTAMQFGYAALGHKQVHIFAARALKDMDPIPEDYATNPAYWP